MKKQFKFILILFSILSINLYSQTFKSDNTKSNIIIEGTSNLHDWKSKATEINTLLILKDNQIQSLNVSIPVKSIKSDEKLMDKKTYEAFNADRFPKIIFTLVSVNDLVFDKNIFCTINGDLTINNITRKISFKINGKKVNDDYYIFNGIVNVKMTDFNITPPVALLGTLKVGNSIKLILNIHMNK